MPSTSESDTQSELQQLRKDWVWLLVLGIGLVIIGVAAVTVPMMATVGAVTVLGILMLVAGASQIVSSFTAADWSGTLLYLLVGILYGVVGFVVLENPLEGAAGLTLLLAVMFLVGGIFRIVVALRVKFPGWGWTLLNGGVSVLLGIIIWRQFPASTLWVIGLLVGIDLLFSGWSWVMLAIGLRQLPDADA